MIVDEAVLHQLLQADHPITIDRLGDDVDAARTVLDRLQKDGCQFEHHPSSGITLKSTGLGVWADYLHYCDGSSSRLIEIYQQTSSTQDIARRMAEQSGQAANGALAIADEQTAGRGRLGRRWSTPPGKALTFSRVCTDTTLGISPGISPGSNIDLLTLAAAVTVTQAIESLTRLDIQIKWPNDILISGKKLAGILVETFETHGRTCAIIGIGVNVSVDPGDLPDDVQNTATSISAHSRSIDRLLLLRHLVQQLEIALNSNNTSALVEAWRCRSTLLGHDIALSTNGETLIGHVIDLDPTQGLILRTHDGIIHHLPAATTTIIP